jgi:hypothetical protein
VIRPVVESFAFIRTSVLIIRTNDAFVKAFGAISRQWGGKSL